MRILMLDLSNNWIGKWDSNGTIALAESFSYLTQLQSLDLSNNQIGYTDSNGTVVLGEIFPYLKQLQVLDLSYNDIGYWDSKGTIVLAKNLCSLTQLEVLDLSSNPTGLINSNGPVALGESLRSLSQLQVLDLSNNWIGKWDSNGVVALAENLASLTQLQSLDLSNNQIGYTDSNGISALLSDLTALTQQSLTTLSLAGIQNIVWTQAANDLEVFINRQLQSSCESQLCHGGSVPQPTIRPRTRSLSSSSDQILSENMFTQKKPSRSSHVPSQKKISQSDQHPFPMEEESFVTSSASSNRPPQFLNFIPYVLHKVPKLISNWWSTPSLSLPPLQETLLEASSPSSPSSYSFSFKPSSQQSSFSSPCEEFKLTSFNACQAGVASSVGYNLCETQLPSFNACVVKPSIVASSLDSVFLLGAFVWKAFISPERQEKTIDWTVPFPEHLKSHIDHKLDRISDILQARSSKISSDTLESYAWSLEDLNNLFAKHYDHGTILLSELMSFQDELDYLLLQLTRFERTSEKHRLEKQFYDGILECYKDLKVLPPLLSVLKEKSSEESFEKYEKDFQHFVEILFNFEMRGKHKKSNKWMKKFKANISTFTREINEEIGAI